MNAALSFHYTLHPSTIFMFWVMVTTLSVTAVLAIIGGFVVDLNGWILAAGMTFMLFLVELVVTVGTLL